MSSMSELATPARITGRSGTARRALLLAIGGCLAVSLTLLVAGSMSANGHAQLHGGTATVLLLVALALAWRSGGGGPVPAIVAVGLTAFAVPMVIEGIGALGYDAVTQERTSDLANLHDVGLVTTSLGMLVLVASIAVVVGWVLVRRSALPRPVAVVIAVVVGIVGMLLTKVLVGGM